ncbi:MAG: hypothetical protein EAZ81_07325, partial [Verrucomicrobia bacterium]
MPSQTDDFCVRSLHFPKVRCFFTDASSIFPKEGEGDQAGARIFPDRNASWPLRLVLTEFQNFQNFAMAIIMGSLIPITLRSGFSNVGPSASLVIQKILKFCQLGLPVWRSTIHLCRPHRA